MEAEERGQKSKLKSQDSKVGYSLTIPDWGEEGPEFFFEGE